MVEVYFVEEDFHASEADLRIPVTVTKNRKLATPLTVELTPFSIVDMISATMTTQTSCPNMCLCTCQVPTFLGELDIFASSSSQWSV